MFTSVCLPRLLTQERSSAVDIGLLAECLLFYGVVKLVADPGTLRQLVTEIEPGMILDLMSDGFLEIHYTDGGFAVRTENTGSTHELHRPVMFGLPDWELAKSAPEIFEAHSGRAGRGRRLARAFEARANLLSNQESGVAEAALEDFQDASYLSEAVRVSLESLAPEYKLPSGFEFVHTPEGEYFSVSTNIDFTAANLSYHLHDTDEQNQINPARLLSNVVNARAQVLRITEIPHSRSPKFPRG